MEERRIKTTLTVEESDRLIDLGVDPKLASECISAMKVCASGRGIIRLPESKPIYTLADILSILPKEIEDSNLDIISTQVDIKNHKKVSGWIATYIDSHNDLTFTDGLVFQAPELIDALYQLLIWILKNGYLKTEKTQ